MKSLREWLLHIEQLHPPIIQLGLNRVQKLANLLDITTFSCPIITVAGTNGKGSCVNFLENILLAAGFNVGTYMSPHLQQFNERIRINGTPLNDDEIIKSFKSVYKEKGKVSLTYFEFITISALFYFKHLSNIDILILEVGMGGRLDAVNVVDADIAVITTIDIDHTQWLGNNREQIGYEKAGIFRPHKLAVCGDFNPPISISTTAKNLNTHLFQINHDFYYETYASYWTWRYKQTTLEKLPLTQLPIQNAATALMVISLLQKDFKIPFQAIEKGIKNSWLPGRFQRLNQSPEIILDVAHNPASATLLAQQLSELPVQNNAAIVGMLADKDIAQTLFPLLTYITQWVCIDLNVPRGAKADAIKEALQDFGVKECYTFHSVSNAYQTIVENMGEKDRIVGFGSFYTVNAILNVIAQP